ncbi:hypothetical protein C0J52_12072 [Blattella germanica]|nr:hypothetical protein C0J52_12072 [Blattella germanica]
MNVTDICIPKDLPVLKDFDNRLRCGICYEYMKTAMMTNCSHNYCSMCIRKSLMYKGSCPTCFAVASDSQLRNNKVVDELIIIFTRLSIEVQKLVQECRGNKPLQYTKDSRNDEESSSSVNRNVSRSGYRSANVETHNSELYFSPSKPSTSFFVSKIKEPKTLPSILKESGEGCSKSKGEEPSNQKTESMPTSNSELQIPSMFTPKKMSIKPAIVTTVNLVPCPVCNVDIAERNINTHLDACLKRSEMTQESSPKQAQKRKHLPKLVISILSDRELKKIMKDHGLSITGSRSALNDRYQRFVVLYNSECDNEHPRSVEDILRQIQKEEMDKKNYTSISSMLKIDRKTEPKIIEQTQQQYCKYIVINQSYYVSIQKEWCPWH